MKEVFQSVISSYEDEILNSQMDILFDKVRSQQVDFTQGINKLIIKQQKKKRQVVCVHEKTIEDITLKYLKKRLDTTFKIKYPNRKNIMKECFSILEAIHSMSDFVIFKFDFKDFFQRVSGKKIYDKYLKYCDLYRYEKDLLEQLANNFNNCSAGLPTSNALIEIISREFDLKLKSRCYNLGLIFYSRYVDDCLLIFNQFVKQDQLLQIINETIEEVFSNCSVELNTKKISYLSSNSSSDTIFDYLGYLFKYKKNGDDKTYFQYGIAENKLKKYRRRMLAIIQDFRRSGDIELFRQRLLFMSSRIVFYNAFQSNYSTISNWDVIGIISNYAELRHFITERDRIEEKTLQFFTYEIIKTIKAEIGYLPYFLKKKPDGYLLKNRLYNNKSIIFHPYIGWTKMHLVKMLRKLDSSISVSKKSYRQLVKIYCDKIKVKA
ncbi:reverse transcriptase domain-containing protein [Ammoniphilus sp. 3BR4]|uniref:reverse transcriptase domain-containing protein n=1 Tax=Ammoniphilus sp. 3BR4 TaxID=3158265 RepID=UPI0034668893